LLPGGKTANSVPPFIYYHHLCSLPTWQQVKTFCKIDEFSLTSSLISFKGRFQDFRSNTVWRERLHSTDEDCDQAMDKMFAEVGDNINQYDIYWPCLGGAGLDCMDYSAITTYLNNARVQAAIHAVPPKNEWSVCTDINYIESWRSVIPIYPQIMKELSKVVVYGGDVTFNVPYLGTQVWVEGLGLPITKNWQAWELDGQVAGYLKKFQGITLVSVKNSGHMIPEFTPESALLLFKMFLQGEL